MSFKEIYEMVEKLKELSIEDLLDLLDINIVINPNTDKAIYVNYQNCPTIVVQENVTEIAKCILLHEIGHHLLDRCSYLNNRANENNANTFMCLMILKNDIWNSDYFDTYLINQGVKPKVARAFNDAVQQRKIQIKYDLAY